MPEQPTSPIDIGGDKPQEGGNRMVPTDWTRRPDGTFGPPTGAAPKPEPATGSGSGNVQTGTTSENAHALADRVAEVAEELRQLDGDAATADARKATAPYIPTIDGAGDVKTQAVGGEPTQPVDRSASGDLTFNMDAATRAVPTSADAGDGDSSAQDVKLDDVPTHAVRPDPLTRVAPPVFPSPPTSATSSYPVGEIIGYDPDDGSPIRAPHPIPPLNVGIPGEHGTMNLDDVHYPAGSARVVPVGADADATAVAAAIDPYAEGGEYGKLRRPGDPWSDSDDLYLGLSVPADVHDHLTAMGLPVTDGSTTGEGKARRLLKKVGEFARRVADMENLYATARGYGDYGGPLASAADAPSVAGQRWAELRDASNSTPVRSDFELAAQAAFALLRDRERLLREGREPEAIQAGHDAALWTEIALSSPFLGVKRGSPDALTLGIKGRQKADRLGRLFAQIGKVRSLGSRSSGVAPTEAPTPEPGAANATREAKKKPKKEKEKDKKNESPPATGEIKDDITGDATDSAAIPRVDRRPPTAVATAEERGRAALAAQLGTTVDNLLKAVGGTEDLL